MFFNIIRKLYNLDKIRVADNRVLFERSKVDKASKQSYISTQQEAIVDIPQNKFWRKNQYLVTE